MIEVVKIKNFRSFKELELGRFARINIFIGKNNLGKSSALEAIYVSANGEDVVHHSPLMHIMRRRGLASEIQHVSAEDALDYLKAHFFYKSADDAHVEIATSFGRYSHKFVFKEQAELLNLSDFIERNQNLSPESRRFLKKLELKGEFYLVGILYHNKSPSVLLLEDEKTNSYKIVFLPDGKASTDYFKFFLDTCMLCESSHRISEIIKKLEPELNEGVYNELKVSLSEYFDEKIKSIELSFGDLYVNTETARIPFSMLGDGLRYFTLHYLVLNLRRPSFIFFEEPENYMHPKMMGSLIQAIIQSRHQIFIVTHSIEFLQKLLWRAKVNEQDLRVFGFYRLSEGIAEIETYTLEQAYTSFNKLEVDLR